MGAPYIHKIKLGGTNCYPRKGSDYMAVTVDDLKKIGAKDVWLRIQQIDESACIHRLMALEGAVCGVKKTMLSDEVKADLKSFYQQHKIK